MGDDAGQGMLDFLSRLNEALNPHVVIKSDNFDWITLITGFGGVVVGAFLSGAIQWWISSRQARQQKRDHEWSLAMRALVQASLILSDVAATIRAIHSSLEAANARGLTSYPLWQRVTPIVGSYSSPSRDADILAPFIAAREYDLVTRYVDMTMKHQVLGEAMTTYNALRTQMDDSMPRTKVDKNGALYTELTEEEVAQRRPLATRLESIITSIRKDAPIVHALAKEVNVALGPAASKYFQDKTFPHFQVVEDFEDYIP